MKLINLLEEINHIPWDKIKSHYGFSNHVPASLRGLISDDTVLVKKSYWELDSKVVEQGFLYPSAFYLMPFLMELVAIRENEQLQYDRDFYDLIIEIAFGCPGLDNYVTYEEVKKEDFTYFIPNEKGMKVPLEVACRSLAAKYLFVLFNELKNNNNQKKMILEIISFFEEYKHTVLKGLEDFKYQYGNGVEEELRVSVDDLIKSFRKL